MHPLVYSRMLKDTLTSIQSYLALPIKPFWRSVWFFLISCLLIGILSGLQFNAMQLPIWRENVAASFAELSEHYPEELSITWDTSQLELTPAEPIEVQYPSRLKPDTSVWPPLLAYITPEETEPQELVAHLPSRTLAIITPTTLYVSAQDSAEGNWNQTALADLPGFESAFAVTTETLPGYLQNGQTIADSVLEVLSWLSLVVWPLGLLLQLLWASLFDTLVFYFLLQLLGFRLPVKRAWQIVLHALVAASVVTLIATSLYPELSIPMRSLATWSILVYFLITLWTQQHALISRARRD